MVKEHNLISILTESFQLLCKNGIEGDKSGAKKKPARAKLTGGARAGSDESSKETVS